MDQPFNSGFNLNKGSEINRVDHLPAHDLPFTIMTITHLTPGIKLRAFSTEFHASPISLNR